MPRYSTTKCGHCGYAWETFKSGGGEQDSGPDLVRCTKCMKINRTSMKYLAQMNGAEMFWYKVKHLFYALCTGAISLGAGYMIFSGEIDSALGWIFALGLGGFLGFATYGNVLAVIKNDFDHEEYAKYLENGRAAGLEEGQGYLWSNQFYDY